MVKQKMFQQNGFTLVEVLMVVVILSVLAAISLPKIGSSSDTARKNADIATAHQVKTALDRYQAENGSYPKATASEFSATGGAVTAPHFIPKYISKLDSTTTQQRADTDKKGFAVATLGIDGLIPATTPTHLIMIYLTSDGSGAEVQAFDSTLAQVIWTSGN